MEQAIEAGSPVRQWLKDLWRALREAQQRRAQAQVLARLDVRTLKDIGLEVQAEEQRRRSVMRMMGLRMGAY